MVNDLLTVVYYFVSRELRKRKPQSVGVGLNKRFSGGMAPAFVKKYFIAALVSFTVFMVYLPSLRNEFVNWDDDLYIYKNAFIRSLDAAFLKWTFFDYYAANWHPLTWLSHALDYAVWGLNPLGHHLTNNLLHAMNTFLVVLLVVRLIEAARDSRNNGSSAPAAPGNSPKRADLPAAGYSRFTLIAAGVTGLLFGLHPVHVESVAWVAERKDLLCALFYLLSLIAYMSYRSQKTHKTYILSLCFFTLALLSKPMAVSLPAVLLILDWYPLKRIKSFKSSKSAFIEKVPFFVLSLISAVMTILAQKSASAMVSLEYAPLSVRVFVAIKALIVYLREMVLPLNLLPFHAYPRVVPILSLEYLLPIILVVGITGASVATAGKQKLWLAAWGYYVTALLPVIGVIRVGSQEMADRYTYLPSLGFFLIIGSGAAWIWEKAGSLIKYGTTIRILTAAIAISAFVGMTYITIRQIGVWENSETLWSRVIEKEPAAARKAYKNRASYFYEINRFDRAFEDYDMLLSIDPSNYEAFFMRKVCVEALLERGNFYLSQGNKELAVGDFRNACRFGNDAGCASLRNLGTGVDVRGK